MYHYDDADIIAQFPSGTVAFEWQSTGHNDIKNLMQKRQNSENKYGRLFFVGSFEAVQEMKNVILDDKIIISRGKQLETLLNNLMNKEQN